MKIYMLCFQKYNNVNNIQVYGHFSTLEKAQETLIEMSKRYKKELVTFNKNGYWSFHISMEKFYNSDEYKDKFDFWFIAESELK